MAVGAFPRSEVLSLAVVDSGELDHHRHPMCVVAIWHRRLLWHTSAGTYQI